MSNKKELLVKVKKSEWMAVISDGNKRSFQGFIETENGEKLEVRFSLFLDKKQMFIRRFDYILYCNNKPELIEIKEIFLPKERRGL